MYLGSNKSQAAFIYCINEYLANNVLNKIGFSDIRFLYPSEYKYGYYGNDFRFNYKGLGTYSAFEIFPFRPISYIPNQFFIDLFWEYDDMWRNGPLLDKNLSAYTKDFRNDYFLFLFPLTNKRVYDYGSINSVYYCFISKEQLGALLEPEDYKRINSDICVGAKRGTTLIKRSHYEVKCSPTPMDKIYLAIDRSIVERNALIHGTTTINIDSKEREQYERDLRSRLY